MVTLRQFAISGEVLLVSAYFELVFGETVGERVSFVPLVFGALLLVGLVLDDLFQLYRYRKA